MAYKAGHKYTESRKITLPVIFIEKLFEWFFAIYIKLLHIATLFKKTKKMLFIMEAEQIFDALDLIIGQITALKLLLFSDRDAAE